MVNDEALQVVHAAEDRYLHDAEFHAEVERAFRTLDSAVLGTGREIPQGHHRPIRLGALIALHLRDNESEIDMGGAE